MTATNGNPYKSTVGRAGRRTPRSGAVVFTTGQIATLCQVAPRTVSMWIDAGHLNGYRIPGSRDRRVPRNALLEFFETNGMADALAYLLSGQSVAFAGLPAMETDALEGALPAGWTMCREPNLFCLGLSLASVSVAVVDASLGRSACLEVGRLARERYPHITLIALTYDDDVHLEEWAEHGYDAALVRPVTPAVVLRAVRGE